jgi:quinol monooxygenase YgiN
VGDTFSIRDPWLGVEQIESVFGHCLVKGTQERHRSGEVARGHDPKVWAKGGENGGEGFKTDDARHATILPVQTALWHHTGGVIPTAFDIVLPGRIGRVVRLLAKPGMRPALLDAVHRYTDRLSVDEPRTEMFVVNVDPDEADLVWLFEWFADADAEVEHRSSPAFAHLMHEMPELLATSPAVVTLEPLRMHMAPDLLRTPEESDS